jgi:hypothetical protein
VVLIIYRYFVRGDGVRCEVRDEGSGVQGADNKLGQFLSPDI